MILRKQNMRKAMSQNDFDIGESLNVHRIEALDRVFLSKKQNDHCEISLDKVKHVDSAGLALVLTWKQRLRAQGFSLKLNDCSTVFREAAVFHGVWTLLNE